MSIEIKLDPESEFAKWYMAAQLILKHAEEKGFVKVDIANNSFSLHMPTYFVRCGICKAIIQLQDYDNHDEWHMRLAKLIKEMTDD